MNLDQLERALGELYPPLVTRSNKRIAAHKVTGEKTPEGLVVQITTVFPPTDRRRSELVVTEAGGALRVRPREAAATADAQSFTERLRERWRRDEPSARVAPMRLERGDDGRYGFVLGVEPSERFAPTAAERSSLPSPTSALASAELETAPAHPAAVRGGKPTTPKGDS